MSEREAPILSVRDLKTYFMMDEGVVKAVDGVSFDVHAGQTFGIVGDDTSDVLDTGPGESPQAEGGEEPAPEEGGTEAPPAEE